MSTEIVYNNLTGEFEKRETHQGNSTRNIIADPPNSKSPQNNILLILLFVILVIVLLIYFMQKPQNSVPIIEEQIVPIEKTELEKSFDVQPDVDEIVNEIEQNAPIVPKRTESSNHTRTTRNQEDDNCILSYGQESSDISRTIGTLRLSYGIYFGEILNGYPDGKGSLVYTKQRVINRLDKHTVAEVGDSIAGRFVRGFVESYEWYDVLNKIKSEEEEPGTPPDSYEEL